MQQLSAPNADSCCIHPKVLHFRNNKRIIILCEQAKTFCPGLGIYRTVKRSMHGYKQYNLPGSH
jgi:hypothetical protein